MDIRQFVRAWARRIRELRPRAVLLIGFAGFLVYGFPGYMSTDSVNQLIEARTLAFSNGHPPVMAAQWALLDRIVAGPVLMLLLQGGLFLGGLYLLLSRRMTERRAAWTSTAILLFPPVLLPMTVIWKDSQMAAYLVAGLGLLVQPRPRIRLVGLGVLVIACALRHNAFAAVVPLVFFVFETRTAIRWWKRVAVMAIATVTIVGAASALSRALTVNQVILTPVFQDIVGMLARTDERPDEEWVRMLEGTPLVGTTKIQERARKLHDLVSAFHIVQGEGRLFDNPRTPEQWAALNRVWKQLILDDPGAYLLSHWDTFAVLLGLGPDPYAPAPQYNLFLEDAGPMVPILHGAQWSTAQYYLGQFFDLVHAHTSLFAPYIYALVAVLLLVICCRDRLTAGLLTSGLLYELSFFPVGVNPDYRYSHWMITATCIATVILYVQRRRSSTS